MTIEEVFGIPPTEAQMRINEECQASCGRWNELLNNNPGWGSLPGLSRWDREQLGISPIPIRNQSGRLLPREQRYDSLTGRYYGDDEPLELVLEASAGWRIRAITHADCLYPDQQSRQPEDKGKLPVRSRDGERAG